MKRLALLALGAALVQPLNAATLVHNVAGYTLQDGELRRFAALEFDAGRVTRLFDTAEAASASEADTRIDGAGATLLPGLIDAHGHMSSLGQALGRVDLVGSTSESDAVRRVAAFAAGDPGGDWVLGRGWNQVLWPGKAFPGRDALDAALGERPVALERIDGHAMWVKERLI